MRSVYEGANGSGFEFLRRLRKSHGDDYETGDEFCARITREERERKALRQAEDLAIAAVNRKLKVTDPDVELIRKGRLVNDWGEFYLRWKSTGLAVRGYESVDPFRFARAMGI